MPSYSVGSRDSSGKVAIFRIHEVANHNEAADAVRQEMGTSLALVAILGGKHPSNQVKPEKPEFCLPTQEELGPPDFA